MQEVHNNGTIVNTLTIPTTVENNNTQLRCHATGTPGPATSETSYLIIAGNQKSIGTVPQINNL